MYKKFDLFFGFFVIAVFLWFSYVLVSSIFNFSIKYNVVKANFSSVDGISKGSDVKIAGVKVGEITDIKLNKMTFVAEVEMKVDSKFSIPKDSSASIQSAGILGAKYVEISPGAEDENLKNGDFIKMTQSSVNLEKLISTFASSLIKK
jgi:phospholipid/cholesterol/gamma-HCH transport system substrate-binding protein